MRFLYKIYSGYDGFSPRRIPDRTLAGGLLSLGWTRYSDVLELGYEVWVYFHGPGVPVPGVYAKGFVKAVDLEEQQVFLKVREFSTDAPLTSPAMSARVAEAVRPRGRQVFVAPEDLEPIPSCEAAACRERLCDRCPHWRSMPVISKNTYHWPGRLEGIDNYVPAYWVVPAMCYFFRNGWKVADDVSRGSRMFYSFKAGEKAFAYPLARGLYEALRTRGELQFNVIVPIPLSPDKLASGELHRTRELSRELGRLLHTRVEELLTLTRPISKRRMRNAGATMRQFEQAYGAALQVEERERIPWRILLVDDVCDHGSTVRLAAAKLKRAYPGSSICAATAGQMIIKEAVVDPALLRN